MKVLVTGANGLLGHHVVTQLVNNGYDVRIIVRSTKKINFDLNKVECIVGSFADKDTVLDAAKSCDAIIHIAAVTDTDLISYDDYKAINVDATKQLVDIAFQLAIKKFIFVSTCNTIGYGNKKKIADETFPIQYPFTKSFYANSKLEAEQLFSCYTKTNHLIIINPTFMIGDYDTKPSSGELILMGYKKSVLFIPNGGKNFVPVKDVANVCCNALNMGTSGEKYLASGLNLTFKEYFKMQSRVGGYKQFIIIIPSFLLKIVGFIGDILRLFKIKTSVCSRNINQLLIKEYYTNNKAKTELLLSETSLESAIQDALNWFKRKDIIK
ncbi:MAG: hypothetical protein BGO29_01875 [Bacteroidales bacterium 36-12]|nr:MAG: hypothetical protein BGO29_01875 [Bacteroidales bacterium 36-12]